MKPLYQNKYWNYWNSTKVLKNKRPQKIVQPIQKSATKNGITVSNNCKITPMSVIVTNFSCLNEKKILKLFPTIFKKFIKCISTRENIIVRWICWESEEFLMYAALTNKLALKTVRVKFILIVKVRKIGTDTVHQINRCFQLKWSNRKNQTISQWCQNNLS